MKGLFKLLKISFIICTASALLSLSAYAEDNTCVCGESCSCKPETPAASVEGATVDIIEEEIYLGVGESYMLSATTKGVYYIEWESEDSSVADIDSYGVVTGEGTGKVTITASAGDVTDVVTVNVAEYDTGKFYETVYLEEDEKLEEVNVYVNGAPAKNVLCDDELISSVNFKISEAYTNLPLSKKYLIGVYSTEERPVVTDGKLTADKDASACASAKINAKTKKITVTAGKNMMLDSDGNAGYVYVHLFSIDSNKRVTGHACLPVKVLAAPTEVKLYSDAECKSEIKGINLNLNETSTVYIKPIVKAANTNLLTSAENGLMPFFTEINDKYKEALDVEITDENEAVLKAEITAKGLLQDGKTGAAVITFRQPYNTKDADLKIKLVNNVDIGSVTATAMDEEQPVNVGDKVMYKLEYEGTNPDYAITDKVKIYAVDAEENDFEILESGRISYTKAKAVTITYKNGVITITRKNPLKGAILYAVFEDKVSGVSTHKEIIEISSAKYGS